MQSLINFKLLYYVTSDVYSTHSCIKVICYQCMKMNCAKTNENRKQTYFIT